MKTKTKQKVGLQDLSLDVTLPIYAAYFVPLFLVYNFVLTRFNEWLLTLVGLI